MSPLSTSSSVLTWRSGFKQLKHPGHSGSHVTFDRGKTVKNKVLWHFKWQNLVDIRLYNKYNSYQINPNDPGSSILWGCEAGLRNSPQLWDPAHQEHVKFLLLWTWIIQPWLLTAAECKKAMEKKINFCNKLLKKKQPHDSLKICSQYSRSLTSFCTAIFRFCAFLDVPRIQLLRHWKEET